MLSYKLIKRKYKINDSNIADFFGYKNRLSFFTSTGKDLIIKYIERTHDRYVDPETGGVKGAAKFVRGLSFPAGRAEAIKAGLFEFIDTINFQNRKGKIVDPEAGPRASMPKYTRIKKYEPKK